MKLRGLRSIALLLGVFLAAANGTPGVAYVDITRVVAAHPLHKVLDAYDREIAALRGTRSVPGLDDLGTRAQEAATALGRDAREAQRQVQRIGARGASHDRALETHALTSVRNSRGVAAGAVNAYGNALASETAASLRGFESGIAQQTSRALAARQQQLREKELTLAYDLARRDAGARLQVRVKLADMHLDRTMRASLEQQLGAMGRRESAAVATLRAQNEAELARYRATLLREGAAANAQMAAQLRSKAGANLALRLSVARTASASAGVVPDLPARLERFGSTYRLGTDAAAIQRGLATAATELPQRFSQLAGDDRGSRAETSAQIQNLQRDRDELYRSIVAQIERDARRLGQERGLRVVVSGPRPKYSVDLSGAVVREEASF
jgi:hypothetical protein